MTEADDLVFKAKNYFKKYPRFFFIFYNLVAVFIGKTAKQFVATLPDDAVIVNIGSGVKTIHPRVINVDMRASPDVQIVASAYALPFPDASVDAVISESLLEHLEHPEIAVQEMYRVLRPGGMVYILTPFMIGFHSSPGDYYRWTIPGMKQLLKNFEIHESGVAVGPTSALTAILREWLAMLLSFGSKTLYQLWVLCFMVLLIPLNLLDFYMRYLPFNSTIALAYYCIAKKA